MTTANSPHSPYFPIVSESKDYGTEGIDANQQNIRFVLDEYGAPLKLGDGTYGSVYAGETLMPGGRYDVAIKVLYNNNEAHTRQLKTLTDGELSEIFSWLIDSHQLADHTSDAGQTEGFYTWQETMDALTTIVRDSDTSGDMLERFRELYTRQARRRLHETEPCYDKHSEQLSFSRFWNELEEGANSTAIYRFELERDINAQIQELLRERFPTRRVGYGNIVEVLGGCKDFQKVLQKEGFERLASHFQSSVSYSDYTLVTKRYDFSLKDLLERSLKQHGGRSGYAILSRLPHALRVREALFIIRPISVALQTLHSVGYFHRDIKPGNILILVLRDENKVEIVLGDLGNLPPRTSRMKATERDKTLFTEQSERDYSPGTVHYRGPEQSHFRDIADVQLLNLASSQVRSWIFSHAENLTSAEEGEQVKAEEPSTETTTDFEDSPRSQQVATLIVRDPKFQNTLIEVGDVVVFSKDSKRKEHTIIDVVRPDESDAGAESFSPIAFVLNETVSHEDQKTQVEFFKSQQHRTDLFSFAAVLFDMLTIGHSAEQFYASLRRYEGSSVDQIVQRYDTLRGGEIDEGNLDFAELFSPFRDEKDQDNPYPPRDIIEVLLKCMLYQSPGTYFSAATQGGVRLDLAHEASERLQQDLNSLFEKYRLLGRENYQVNLESSILLHGERWTRQQVHSESFSHLIDELQGLREWFIRGTNLNMLDRPLLAANRLMYGAYYFWKMARFVRTSVVPDSVSLRAGDESSGNVTTLHQILPTFITVQRQENERGQEDRYTAEPQYKATAPSVSLQGSSFKNHLELFIDSPSNPFVPNEVAGMNRTIRLLATGAEVDEKKRLTCCYRFLDTAVVYRRMMPGDWIVLSSTHSARIVDCSDDSSDEPKVTLCGRQGDSLDFKDLFENDANYVDALYFSAVDPLKYYFEMLALYLQHLIFVFSPITETTRDQVNIRGLLSAFEIEPEYSIKEPPWESSNLLRGIHERYVHMFVKLTLHEAKGSYYDIATGNIVTQSDAGYRLNSQMFSEIRNDAEELYRYILKNILNVREGAIEDFCRPFVSLDDLPEAFLAWIDELTNDKRINIEIIVKRSDQIEGWRSDH